MFKKLNNKRGFSLVELMVVVAIMGTLASIAIPAFNSYRKSAKKTAYKSDLTALHKGWQAFGVEIDSYCERETNPGDVSIANVGMASLVTSKLYGARGGCEDPATPVTGCSCSGQTSSTTCSSHANAGGVTCSCSWNASAGTGPGKHNFIGFTSETCGANVNASDVQILGEEGGTPTTASPLCILKCHYL